MSREEHHCASMDPDWTRQCENCDQTPVVPITGLCGPCTFGEAATMHGNWNTQVIGREDRCEFCARDEDQL